jgi:hypothetical protein
LLVTGAFGGRPILQGGELAFQFGDAGFDQGIDYWRYRLGGGSKHRLVEIVSQWRRSAAIARNSPGSRSARDGCGRPIAQV